MLGDSWCKRATEHRCCLLLAGRQAYVRQEDIFFSQLTVRETLQMAARLRLPAAMPAEETDRRVDALIQRLGLVGAPVSLPPLSRGSP